MINGMNYQWESLTFVGPNGLLIGIKEISFDESKETEAVYGAGSNPIDFGTGNRKIEGKMTLHRSEYDRFLTFAKASGVLSILDLLPTVITISYLNIIGKMVNEVLMGVKFSKIGHKASQGDKELTVELDFLALDKQTT